MMPKLEKETLTLRDGKTINVLVEKIDNSEYRKGVLKGRAEIEKRKNKVKTLSEN